MPVLKIVLTSKLLRVPPMGGIILKPSLLSHLLRSVAAIGYNGFYNSPHRNYYCPFWRWRRWKEYIRTVQQRGCVSPEADGLEAEEKALLLGFGPRIRERCPSRCRNCRIRWRGGSMFNTLVLEFAAHRRKSSEASETENWQHGPPPGYMQVCGRAFVLENSKLTRVIQLYMYVALLSVFVTLKFEQLISQPIWYVNHEVLPWFLLIATQIARTCNHIIWAIRLRAYCWTSGNAHVLEAFNENFVSSLRFQLS